MTWKQEGQQKLEKAQLPEDRKQMTGSEDKSRVALQNLTHWMVSSQATCDDDFTGVNLLSL